MSLDLTGQHVWLLTSDLFDWKMEAGRQPVVTWDTKNQTEHVGSWSHDVTSRPHPAFHLSFCGNWARSLRKNIGNDGQLRFMSGNIAGTFGPPCINSINDLLISLPCSVLCPGKTDLEPRTPPLLELKFLFIYHCEDQGSQCKSGDRHVKLLRARFGKFIPAGQFWLSKKCGPNLARRP